MIAKSTFRPTARVRAVSGGISSVRTIPSGVSSNIHAHAIANGNPASRRTMIQRTATGEMSKNGKTCVATWIKSQATAE